MFKTILSNFHLEKIIWSVKIKWKYIVVLVLVMSLASGALAYYTQTSTYLAKISLYVYSSPDYVIDSGVNLSSSDFAQAKTLLDSYMQIINSNTFLKEVIKEVGLEDTYTVSELRKNIKAEAIANTAVFNVSVYDEDPINARDIANIIGALAPEKITRIVKSGGIEVIDQAELPTEPFSTTNILKYMVFGGLIGLILAVFYAMVTGLLNTVIRKRYEVEEKFTIPILGEVPLGAVPTQGQDINMVLHKDSPGIVKEAYRSICVKLLVRERDEKCPVYIVTSADANEGKGIAILNTGIAYAQFGKRVLIIDADMRKSDIAEIIGLKAKEGLGQYLAGDLPEASIDYYRENLDIILSGDSKTNAPELLASANWEKLLKRAKKEYDVIFIDVPPVGMVLDALSITEESTMYILVIQENMTKFDREEDIVRELEQLDVNICGFIYNEAAQKSLEL